MANEKRLIDANALKSQITRYHMSLTPRYISKLVDAEIGDVIDIIDEAPTVDAVEVVHGTWLDWHGNPVSPDEFYRWWRCSECKYQYVFDEAVNREHFPSNYCPNCGSKMDL